jgi:hypothetical protein
VFTLAGFVDGPFGIERARAVYARANEQWRAELARTGTAPSSR